MALDQEKLDRFLEKFVLDFGAVMHAATIVVGDKLGLYKGLAAQPLSAEELARNTETDPRYILEWLSAQAARGYVNYDASTGKLSLSDEQKSLCQLKVARHFSLERLMSRLRSSKRFQR